MAQTKATKRRGGGGKLTRSEQVSIRLDPKLRFAAELAASKERRTLSSFAEWAVERAVREVAIAKDKDGTLLTASEVVELVWDDAEPDRFGKLALNFPELLTHEERVLWNAVRERDALWVTGALDFSLLRCLWGEIVLEAKTGRRLKPPQSLEELFAPLNEPERQFGIRLLTVFLNKTRHLEKDQNGNPAPEVDEAEIASLLSGTPKESTKRAGDIDGA